MSSAHTRRLSALIVNHDSGAWCLRAVESLMLEWERDGREPRDLEVIVLDSGSCEGESTWWRSLRALGARVVTCEENVGYALGLNRAYEHSSGGPDDIVALLNPDLYFLPGSLRPLLERLEEAPEVGLVAPRCFVDEARVLRLPPNELPTPGVELLDLCAARMPRLGRRLAAARSARARRWWGTDSEARARMLSGACLFLRRGVVDALGAPMDGAYPLYFEDADLCRRLTRLGHALELVPAAEVLHHWSRSAGPDFAGDVASRWARSHARYLATYHDGPLGRLARVARAWLQFRLGGTAPRPIHALSDLGALHEPPSFELEEPGAYQLELSLTAHWGLSAGVLFEGAEFRLPANTWSWLFPGTYYARIVEARGGRFVRAWCFEKTSAARSWPLDPQSLPRPRRVSRPSSTPGHGERVG